MNEYTKIIYLMGTKISLYVKGDVTEKLLEKACSMLIHYEEVLVPTVITHSSQCLKKQLPWLLKKWMRNFMS